MLFYQGRRVYFRGIAGGVHLYHHPAFQVNAVSRIHFVDIPDKYQNKVQPTNLDTGIQFRYLPAHPFFVDVEGMLDIQFNPSVNLRVGMEWRAPGYYLSPYLQAKWKSSDYNSHYYGLTLETIPAGVDYSVGFLASAHVWSNFSVMALGRLTRMGPHARQARYVEDTYSGEFQLGFGFSNDPTRPRKQTLHNHPYVRVAHGWATHSDFWHTNFFQLKPDSLRHQLTSLFYGHPLTDEVLGIPMDVYLTPGLAFHWPSSHQSSAVEVVLALKVYLNIPWPIRWRLGGSEGFSYINHVTYIERTGFAQKGYQPVKFLNYLDWSYDFNVGDVVGERFEHLWLGYGVHHRSGIYEAAQQFGRVNGGSNYYTFYLQWEW
jgi:outer membrane protein